MGQMLPDDFFTWTSLGSLAGASGATFIITNTLRSALDWSPKWLGLAIAQIICIGAAISLKKNASDYILVILNGCLVYLSAVGVASASSAAATVAVARGNFTPARRRSFLSAWF